jgi:hypothetical protein
MLITFIRCPCDWRAIPPRSGACPRDWWCQATRSPNAVEFCRRWASSRSRTPRYQSHALQESNRDPRSSGAHDLLHSLATARQPRLLCCSRSVAWVSTLFCPLLFSCLFLAFASSRFRRKRKEWLWIYTPKETPNHTTPYQNYSIHRTLLLPLYRFNWRNDTSMALVFGVD